MTSSLNESTVSEDEEIAEEESDGNEEPIFVPFNPGGHDW